MPIWLRVGRQGFRVTTTSLSHTRGLLTRRSVVAFTFGPERLDSKTAKRLLEDTANYGGKLGLRIQKSQTIKSLEVAGMELRPDAKVSRELHRTLGAGPREKWVGFPLLGNRALLGPGFKTVLKITFRPRTKLAFQLVPIVVTFGNLDFGQHYVLGVSVLKTGKPHVDSFIEVVSGR